MDAESIFSLYRVIHSLTTNLRLVTWLCFWPIRSEQIVCVILTNQTQANCVFDTDAPEWFSIFSSKVVAWKDLDKKAQKIFSLKIRTLSFLVGRSWTTPHMLEYVREISPSLQNRLLCVRMSGSGCGSVGRAVATNSRGPWFKSSHRKKIYIEHLQSTVLKIRK